MSSLFSTQPFYTINFDRALADKDYVFESRGEIEVKGKGKMVTYFLKSRPQTGESRDSEATSDTVIADITIQVPPVVRSQETSDQTDPQHAILSNTITATNTETNQQTGAVNSKSGFCHIL